MAKTAFIFPGQGSQYAGMGRDFVGNFPVFSRVFEEASDRLDFDLLEVVMNGTNEDLMRTEVTQPALLTVPLNSAIPQNTITGNMLKLFLLRSKMQMKLCIN